MKVTVECTIDLDEKRKVWVSSDADIEITEETLSSMATATVSGAAKAFHEANARSALRGLDGFVPESDDPKPVPVTVQPQKKEPDLRGMGEV